MKHLGDICKINGAEIEIVDVITGGSPCQDLSIAGKRAGLTGARSGLFMEQVRIVKEMREHDRANGRTGDMVRSRFMVWENVIYVLKCINDVKSYTLDATDRHGVCSGFEATPINLMVATRCKELGRGTGFGVGEPGDPANTISASHSHGVFATAIGNQVPLAYGIGNGQACEASIMAEEIAQTLNTMHDAQTVMCEDVSHALRAKANCAYREDAETYPVQNMVVRRLTPMECERLQGFPDGWTDIGEWRDSKGKMRKPSDSPRYKALGNSIALPFWDFLAKRISAQYLRPVTMGSLFDGIGGFPLVFERHNGKGTARWASEIEEFPIAVTKLRFGED